MEIKKSALVCSGGGALGITLLGILEKLEQENTVFDWYAGVSIGALITSFLACGYSAKDIFRILDETSLLTLSFDFSPSNFGLIKGDKVYEILENKIGNKTFEELEFPLFIGATDFQTGERVIINSGKIIDAVRASVSVPVLFEPYFHPTFKRWLVDGGLSQNLPLDIAIEHYQGNHILALDLSGIDEDIDFSEKKLFQKNKTIARTLGRTFKIFFQNQQRNLPTDPRVQHIRIASPFESIDVFKLQEMYVWGKENASRFL